MKPTKSIYILLSLFLMFSCEDNSVGPLVCGEGLTNVDGKCVYICEEGITECYYQGDLDVLQLFIDNSDSTINIDLDIDSSGVIEPLELGEQEWVDGRMTEWNCGYPSYCEVSGSIPSEIGNLTNLTGLNLGYNELTGEIPPEIGQLTSLTSLTLGWNQLTGEIPPEIWEMTNLVILSLFNNELLGIVPSEICNLINLDWTLDTNNPSNFQFGSFLFNNNLCPPYPECIKNYVGEQDCEE